MKPSFKELHRIIVELSPEEASFISTKLDKDELEKIRLLSGKKTITELNSLQNLDTKIGDKEIEDLTVFLKNLFNKEKSEAVSSNSLDNPIDIVGNTSAIHYRKAELHEADSLSFIYETIVSYLSEYKTSYESKVIKWLDEMEDLFNKRLYKASYYYLKNSYNLAAAYEDFDKIDRILKWEKRFLGVNIETDYTLEQLDEALLLVRVKAANYWQYKILNQKFINGKTKIYATEEDKLKILEQLVKDPLLTSEDKALSVTAKMHFHEIGATLSMEFNDFVAAKNHWKAMISHFQNNAQFIHKKVRPYVYIIHNYINLCLILKQHKEMEAGIEVLEQLPKRFPHIISKSLYEDIKLKTYSHKFNLYSNLNHFYKCFKLIPQVDRFLGITKLPVRPTVKAVMNFEMAAVLHLYDKYEKAVQKLDTVLEQENDGILNFKVIASSLKLICLIDLESQNILEKTLIATKKFYKQNQVKSKLHLTIVKLASKILVTSDPIKRNLVFEKYLHKVKDMDYTVNKHVSFNHFEIKHWLQSKVTGERYLTLIKQSLKN